MGALTSMRRVVKGAESFRKELKVDWQKIYTLIRDDKSSRGAKDLKLCLEDAYSDFIFIPPAVQPLIEEYDTPF